MWYRILSNILGRSTTDQNGRRREIYASFAIITGWSEMGGAPIIGEFREKEVLLTNDRPLTTPAEWNQWHYARFPCKSKSKQLFYKHISYVMGSGTGWGCGGGGRVVLLRNFLNFSSMSRRCMKTLTSESLPTPQLADCGMVNIDSHSQLVAWAIAISRLLLHRQTKTEGFPCFL